jgi:hypothetical protein
MLFPLIYSAAAGQPNGPRRMITPAASAAPSVSILTAATGALVRSRGADNAALDLGSVSYFKRTSVPGESSRKLPSTFVISTRFTLKVDCPASSRIKVSMARTDAGSSHAIAIDGTTLGTADQILVWSMSCGSAGEHRLDVEIPVSTSAGSIGSTVVFMATLEH